MARCGVAEVYVPLRLFCLQIASHFANLLPTLPVYWCHIVRRTSDYFSILSFSSSTSQPSHFLSNSHPFLLLSTGLLWCHKGWTIPIPPRCGRDDWNVFQSGPQGLASQRRCVCVCVIIQHEALKPRNLPLLVVGVNFVGGTSNSVCGASHFLRVVL